jgi:hypothetical protein
MDKETIKNYLVEIQNWMYEGKVVLAYAKLKFVLDELKNDLKLEEKK